MVMTGGHGHVVPRPDGAKARCGGLALCSTCAKELAAQQTVTAPTPEPTGNSCRAEESGYLDSTDVFCPFASDGQCTGGCPTNRDRACINGEES